ncbi:DsbA family protein [Nocardia sp. JMUB6875]|uniref:DsbA family protein n=1 Tax=Nocardia sp. JMUB6875 TaxID=3158170 RepID=UPI0034E87858
MTTEGVVSAQVSKTTGKNPLANAAKADRNRKILIQVGVAVVLLGLIAGIGITLAMRKHNDDKAEAANSFHWDAAQAALVPANLTPEGAIRIDNTAAPAPEGKQKVNVRVVADVQCPACAMFENANADALKKAVQSGQAVVDYNIITFLDRASGGNQFSTRGAAAAYVMYEADPSKFQGWLAEMYAKQPKEGGAGMTDDQLIQIAKDAGYTDPAVAQAIKDGKYTGWVKTQTDKVFATGVKSTPTVYVNGTQVQDPQALMGNGGMTAVIENAGK